MGTKSLVLKNLSLIAIMGMVYFTLEGFWRGWTNIAMFFIGGLCAWIVGQLNQYPKFYILKIWQQSLIGTVIVTAIEFISGMILNVHLGLNLWDYSNMWGNIYGQICPQYMVLWYGLMAFCIWFDDWLRFKIYGEGKYYPIYENYIWLFTGK